MRRRALFQRRIEILAKGRAERGLETALHLDLFKDGGEKVARSGIQHLGKRAGLGLDAAEFGP